ncbi:MAG: FtsX-like permease family protein, partial [candidate division KSB1 bacterium]|nr:FtsX-like permease family protein [candidate division KSB1 bacterium]
TINHLDDVIANLQHEPIVEQFSLRTFSLAMITSPANVSAINLVGIDPATEKHLSQIDEAITQGDFFEAQNERDIVIGNKLAELLEVEIGDRIVVTVSQRGSGDLSQEMFRVSGIYRFGIQEMDGAMAFVRLEKAQQMLALGNDVHEIAIKFFDTRLGRQDDLPFWGKYSRHGNEAVGWTTVLPQLKAAFELSQFSIFITGIILFGVVALGIINTLFMSLHERMFEFGVLRAVGTRPAAMARLIIFEAGALALLSIGLGGMLGFVVTHLVAKIGIDYTGIEFAGVTFRELIYPVLQVKQFVFYPFWVFVFTSLVAIYPAIHAARMSPAEAMRKSL